MVASRGDLIQTADFLQFCEGEIWHGRGGGDQAPKVTSALRNLTIIGATCGAKKIAASVTNCNTKQYILRQGRT